MAIPNSLSGFLVSTNPTVTILPQVGVGSIADHTRPTPATEKPFTIPQIAKMWAMSETTARNLFENEDGVLRVGLPSRRVARKLRRSYVTLYAQNQS